jgi:hypothetical protein
MANVMSASRTTNTGKESRGTWVWGMYASIRKLSLTASDHNQAVVVFLRHTLLFCPKPKVQKRVITRDARRESFIA